MTAHIPQHVIDDANGDIIRVIGSYIQIKKSGAEYEACCPFHHEKTPSFKVNPKKGMYHCFGCGASGDAVEFVIQHTGCTFTEAVERITGTLPSNPIDTRSKRDDDPPKWVALKHAPENAPQPNFKHYKHGMPSSKWAYHDDQGRLVGYVCRFDFKNDDGSDGKETIPITWAKSSENGSESWRWLSFVTPRTLFGIPDLISKPSAKVLIVEGEKTREAAAALFPQFAVVSWPGGGKAVHKADWALLAGRNVCFWPDFDKKNYKDPHPKAGQKIPVFYQAGVKAMFDIYQIIKDKITDAKIVTPCDDAPCGWDLADNGWYDGFDAKRYARDNLVDAKEWFDAQNAIAEVNPESKPEPKKEPKKELSENIKTLEKSFADFFTVIGICDEHKIWIKDNRTSECRVFREKDLSSKSTLLSLASLDQWDAVIGHKFTVDAAFSLIIEIAKAKPRYQRPVAKTQSPDRLTGNHGADSAIIANLMRQTNLFDEYSDSWYSWDKIWRRNSEGNVGREIIRMLDDAFNMEYEVSAFNGTYNLLKRRLGRSPQMNGDATIVYDTWNRDGNLLPMKNGVLNMTTGELLPHSPELMMPWMIPHDYIKTATCPVTENFLNTLAHGDDATFHVLLCWLAAILHGRADLQKYMELVGMAGTGKSTFISICKILVGEDNIVISTMEQLNKNRFETASLFGKRLVIISDADKYGGQVDVFKAITGGDPIRYEEKLKQTSKPFVYGGMVLVAANQPLQFTDSSTAMVRRRIPVHIDHRLDKKDVDPNLMSKISDEISGLINLLLIIKPDVVTSKLRDFDGDRNHAEMRAFCETNNIAAWLDERCVVTSGYTRIGTSKNPADEFLYSNYALFCEETGRKGVQSMQSFTRAVLDALSYCGIKAEKDRNMHGKIIHGIRLRSPSDDLHPTLLTKENMTR